MGHCDTPAEHAGKPAQRVPGEGYILAVDAGTTTVRAVLFDLEGMPVAEAYREPQLHHPQPGWAELEPEDWWQCAVAVIREVTAKTGAAHRILGVGLSGLQHAMVPIDREGNILGRAMLWMDQRCAPQVEWMSREYGDLLEQETGRRLMSTTFSAPKLRWLSEHAPDLLRRTDKFLPIKDFLRYRLTGTIGTDDGDAGGTGMLHRTGRDWSRPLLELAGVSPEQIPPIRDSSEVAGGVLPEMAQLTGLVAGTPVVIGGGDVKCTRIGTDAAASGRGCLYLGTAAWAAVPQRRLGAFGSTATTGAALKWLVRFFGLTRTNPAEGYAALLDGVDEVAPGAGGLLFLPHLMGERGPKPDPKAKGVLFGLTLAHRRPEVARAVLEGCAYHLRSILEDVSLEPVREIVVAGGGGKTALWRQIIADVTGTTLLMPQVLEAGALGAAMMAGVGVGAYASMEDAAHRVVRIVGRCEPDPEKHAVYSRIYEVYRDLEERVAPLYARVPVQDCEEG